jgi:hypothetical protein
VPSGCDTRAGVNCIFKCIAGKFQLDSFFVTYVLEQRYLHSIESLAQGFYDQIFEDELPLLSKSTSLVNDYLKRHCQIAST